MKELSKSWKDQGFNQEAEYYFLSKKLSASLRDLFPMSLNKHTSRGYKEINAMNMMHFNRITLVH